MDALHPGLTGRRAFSVDEFCAAHGEYGTEIFVTGGRKERRVTLSKIAKKIADWGGKRTKAR